MGDVIRGQFGRPRKPIEARLRLDLREEVITVEGEEWLVVTLNGDVVQVVPIQPGTAPEPRRLAKVIRVADTAAAAGRQAKAPEPPTSK